MVSACSQRQCIHRRVYNRSRFCTLIKDAYKELSRDSPTASDPQPPSPKNIIHYLTNVPQRNPSHFFPCSCSLSIASLVSFCNPSTSCSASVISSLSALIYDSPPHQHPIVHPSPNRKTKQKNNKKKTTYRRLRITPQLPLPMALPLLLLVQRILLVVVNLRFAVVGVLVCI